MKEIIFFHSVIRFTMAHTPFLLLDEQFQTTEMSRTEPDTRQVNHSQETAEKSQPRIKPVVNANQMNPQYKEAGKIRNEIERHKKQSEFILGMILPLCLRETRGLCVELRVFIHTSRWSFRRKARWSCVPREQLSSHCVNSFSVPTLTFCHCWTVPVTLKVLTRSGPGIFAFSSRCMSEYHTPLCSSKVHSYILLFLFQSKPFALFLWGPSPCLQTLWFLTILPNFLLI